MSSIERLSSLPANIDEFIEEIATGFGGLYGELAGTKYREQARAGLGATIRHPAITTYADIQDSNARALVMSVDRKGTLEHITLIHVLGDYEGETLERGLIETAVESMRRKGVTEILSESTCFCSLDLAEAFDDLGFAHIPRSIMLGELDSAPLRIEASRETRPIEDGEEALLGKLFYEAYIRHPGSDLHREVRNPESAEDLVRGVLRRDYGYCVPEYARVLLQNDRFIGGILGCEIAPEVGFIMQVAVDPGCRNQGIGTTLIREACAAFRDRGLKRVALGVTNDNPAVRLYEKLGFVRKFPVDAYTWRAKR